MKNVAEKGFGEYQNKSFMFNNLIPEYRTIYEIMWKKMAGPDRPQITI
jgi:hypothetical protein